MRRNPKASLSFKVLSPSKQVTFGANVISCLTPAEAPAKNSFPDLPVPLADLQAENDALANAVTQALSGNHTAVAALRVEVAKWKNVFTLTANYISSIANGDVTIIRSAGFVPTKNETQPAQKPAAVSDFKVAVNGSRGAIIAGSKKPVDTSKAYVYAAMPADAAISYNGDIMMVTIADKTIYITAATSKQTEFYNLPSGVPYIVSMYAINTAGSGPATPGQQVIPQ